MFENEVTGMADVPVSVVSRQRFDVNARAATVRPKIQQVINFSCCVKVTTRSLRFISRAVKTESPLLLKPNGNACYVGYTTRCYCYLYLVSKMMDI